MRAALVIVVLGLMGCGGSSSDCPETTPCAGADLIQNFSAGPGVEGRVCQWWSTGKESTFHNAGSGWCEVPAPQN